MPRGTTLVGLPQPTQSVQNKTYSIPLLTITGGIRPSLTALVPFAIAFSLAAPGWVQRWL